MAKKTSSAKAPSKEEKGVIEIDGVEAIIDPVRLPIPEKGGVVLLRGTHGTGKSTAIECVEAMYDKDTRRGLRPSDNRPFGRIRGLGMDIRIARANTAKGELEVTSLDPDIDPSLLVNPGIKDPEAADRARLRQLIRMATIDIPARAWNEYLSKTKVKIANVEDLISSDPVETADRLRRALHGEALKHAKAAERFNTEAEVHETSAEEIPVPEERRTLDEIQQLMDTTAEDLATTRTKIQSAKEEADNLEELRETLGSLTGEEQEDREAIESRLSATRERRSDLQARKRALEDELARVDSKIEGCNESIESDKDALEIADRRNQRQTEVQEVIEKITERLAAAPTEDDLTRLEEQQDELRQWYYAEMDAQRRDEALRIAAQRRKEAEEEFKTEARLRDQARGTDSVLEKALKGAGFKHVKIYHGRFCVETDRGLEPFEELSHGEKVKLVFDLVARGSLRLLPWRQEDWESQNEENKRDIAKQARKRGIVVVTAQVTMDETLTAEIWSPDQK